MVKRKSETLPFEGWIMTGAVAKRLGVVRRHVNNLIESGELEAVKIADRWLVNPESLEGWERKRKPKDKPIE